MPVYIEKKVEIWSAVTIAARTNEQTNKQGKIELLREGVKKNRLFLGKVLNY